MLKRVVNFFPLHRSIFVLYQCFLWRCLDVCPFLFVYCLRFPLNVYVKRVGAVYIYLLFVFSSQSILLVRPSMKWIPTSISTIFFHHIYACPNSRVLYTHLSTVLSAYALSLHL